MRGGSIVLVAVLLLPAVVGCGNGWRPPDASAYAPEKIVWDHPRLAGPFIRDLVVIAFQPDASRRERREAVRLVNGTVVGRVRIAEDDGYYVVRFPDAGSADALERVLATLERLPQVQFASPEYLHFDDSDLVD